jgi:putative transposase
MSDHAGRHSYPSDLTDAQWALVEPLLPPERGGRGWGRPLTHPRREIVNAILYAARAGCSWRQLPGDLPPWATVYDYFALWNADGTVDSIHDRLRDAVRD